MGKARRHVVEDYNKWAMIRVLWLMEGVKNTSFSHKMVNAHRRRNDVDRIRINSVWILKENEIK